MLFFGTNNSSLLYCKFSNKKFKICFRLKVIKYFLLCFRVFFYNPTTKTSVWEKPAEMVGRNDVAKMLESSQVSRTVLITFRIRFKAFAQIRIRNIF
jgi:hypothetical protein